MPLASCGDGCSRRRSNRRLHRQNKRRALTFLPLVTNFSTSRKLFTLLIIHKAIQSELITVKHILTRRNTTRFTASSTNMAPSALVQRRTHNLLLFQKLLNLRDGASPFTLLLDTVDQSAKPVVKEFMTRAKVPNFLPVLVVPRARLSDLASGHTFIPLSL